MKVSDHAPKNMQQDDSDVKIFQVDQPEEAALVDDADRIAEQLEDEMEKGNIHKARMLGKKLAEKLLRSNFSGEGIAGVDVCLLNLQLALLHVYSVKVGLEAFTPNQLISNTAFNVFLETIHDQNPDLYQEIHRSQAFSFYLLCTRDSEQQEYAIGCMFAKLCDMENLVDLVRFGQKEYDEYLKNIQNEVKICKFE